MRASDIMTLNVVSCGPDTPINEIARRLFDRGISAMPVVDAENHVLGVVSEGDLMRRVELGTAGRSWWLDLFASTDALAHDYVKTHGRTARSVMTRPAVVVEENAGIAEIAQLLDRCRIKRVPVVRDGRLVGIVSRADIMRGLIVAAKRWGQPRHVDDATIRTALLDEIKRLPFAGASWVNVVVDHGEVHLWGPVDSADQRAAIRVAAENAKGVSQVVDNLFEWHMQAGV
jgi:CBS domain-containing protein